MQLSNDIGRADPLPLRCRPQELKITAVLFGSLVHRRLVSGGALATALRCVAEAARSPPGSKLSKFALEALAQFRDELAAWPDFCATLLQVPARSPAHFSPSGTSAAP